MTLTFRVYGIVQPAGSARAFLVKGRPIITSTNRNLKAWQRLVSTAAQEAIARLAPEDRTLLESGVRLSVVFALPRPLALPKKKPRPHTTKPDLDKCVRGICDALTGIVFRDDAQVCELVASKRYAPPGAIPSVEIAAEASEAHP